MADRVRLVQRVRAPSSAVSTKRTEQEWRIHPAVAEREVRSQKRHVRRAEAGKYRPHKSAAWERLHQSESVELRLPASGHWLPLHHLGKGLVVHNDAVV